MPSRKIENKGSGQIDQRATIEADVTRLTTYWNLRDVRIAADKDIINLIKPVPKTGEIKWTSNEPKVFFDTARALVSINSPRFRLPMSMNHDPEEKDRMNKAERLCIGISRTWDNRIQDRGGVSWLWELAYWVLLGWYAVYNPVVKVNGQTVFMAELWDPTTVYPLWDTDGLAKCVRVYEVDKMTAMAMADNFIRAQDVDKTFTEPSDDGSQKIVNWWRRRFVNNKPVVENAIMISGQVVKPITKQTKMQRIPIRVGAIGIPDRTTDNWEERWGESIIASARDFYEYQNIILSLRATITASQTYPNMLSKTRSGQPAVKAEDVQGYGSVIPLKLEDELELLRNAVTPEDADILLNFINTRIEKANVPAAVYGSIPVELSGFALSQLLAAVKYKLGPYLNAMQNIISGTLTDHLYQYKQTGGNISLSTLNPHDLKRGMTYIEEYTPKDVPEHIYVEVTIPITSQFDKTQSILNAKQALTPPQIFSRETLWETELDVQDSEQEYQRIRNDQVLDDPFVQQIDIIEGMWQRVKYYESKGWTQQAEALKRYIMGMEMQLGMRQGIVQKPGAPGVPPQQSPPEMNQSPNPDQRRAMTGTPPPRPVRPESEGRKGILTAPPGQ